MKKYFILLVSLLVVFHANAMEKKQCYLNKLPIKILDLIASYLMESKTETIARIIRNKQYRYLDQGPFVDISVNENEIIIFEEEKNPPQCRIPKLSKFTITQGDREYKGKVNPELYKCIALSPYGTMIALHYVRYPEESWKAREAFLEIRKIDFIKDQEKNRAVVSKEKKEISLPQYTSIPKALGFNRQGTDLIAYFDSWSFDMKDITFLLKATLSLKGNDPYSFVPSVVNTTNNLQKYLRDKFVCNKCIEGVK